MPQWLRSSRVLQGNGTKYQEYFGTHSCKRKQVDTRNEFCALEREDQARDDSEVRRLFQWLNHASHAVHERI